MRGVVTDVLPLEEFDAAIHKMASGQQSIKVVLQP